MGRGEIAAEFTEMESSRNVAFISNRMESRVDFVAVDIPEANRPTIHIFAAVAEHERVLISKRTENALGQ